MKHLLLTILLGSLLVHCGNYQELKRTPPSGLGKSVEVVDFATVKAQILDNNCINCHQPQRRHETYSDYTIVRADARNMLREMEAGTMPKNRPPLPPEQVAMFRAWVEAGSPQFLNDNDQQVEATISFADVKERVFDAHNCTSCHAHYNDYDSVRRSIGSIVTAIEQDAMPLRRVAFPVFPKVTPLPEEDKQVLRDWVAQDMPFEKGVVPPAPQVLPLEANWDSIFQNILGPKCVHCHNSYGPKGGASRFESYEATFDNMFKIKVPDGSYFDFENPEESLFIKRITVASGNRIMPPDANQINEIEDVETAIAPLTTEERQVLLEWITKRLPR